MTRQCGAKNEVPPVEARCEVGLVDPKQPASSIALKRFCDSYGDCLIQVLEQWMISKRRFVRIAVSF